MSGVISREGAYAFLDLTLGAWEHRLIDGETLVQRMQALAALIDGKDWPFSDDHIVSDDGGSNSGDTHIDAEHAAPGSEQHIDNGESIPRKGAKRGGRGPSSHSVPERLYLVTKWIGHNLNSPIRVWEFHKGDPDPNPSVPHGHHLSIHKRKLDAYTGHTSDDGERSGRVKRKDIASLWNSEEFRMFAREALMHFIAANPQYQFRVAHPLRLPRKRR